MMIREVNYLRVHDYIRAAWESDKDLTKFYDRSLKNPTTEKMVMDTFHKITDFYSRYPETKMFGIDVDGKESGFIVLENTIPILYSFGFSVEVRKPDMLEMFFNFIKNKLGGDFCCLLYEHNTRAVNWLKRCGMIEDVEGKPESGLVLLKNNLCQ